MAPLVSVLIPCRNAAPWVAAAVESALAQTWPNIEVIVADDGSTDGSRDLLRRFGDRVAVIEGPQRGGNAARNALLRAAKGDWLQYLDADDALYPDKISQQLATARQHPRADLVHGPVQVHLCTDAPATSEAPTGPQETLGPVVGGGPTHWDAWERWGRWELAQTGGMLLRKTALERVGGWDETRASCQDNALQLALLQAGAATAYCPDLGALYRRFDRNTVSTRDPDLNKREILSLLDQAETWLTAQRLLTPRRLDAFNQHRFTLTRQLWATQRPWAREIHHQIQRSQPDFQPEPSRHAPRFYRLAYRLLGWNAAELLANLKRRLSGVDQNPAGS